MGTGGDIIQRENKTSTVCTAKSMDAPLKNITARRSTGKNARNVTIGVAKKRSSGRNKKMTKIGKRKRLMSLKIYIMKSSSLEDDTLACENKKSTRKLSKCSLLTQDLRHI